MKRTAMTLASLLLACDAGAPKQDEPAPQPAEVAAPRPEPVKPAAPPTPKYPPGEPDEACARIVVVAWQGLEGAPPEVTRDQAAARAQAEALQKKLSSGTDFAELAAQSDEPKTRAKRGAMGTYTREKWPEKYAALQAPVFALGIGETSEVVETPVGFVVAQRCAVEKVHARHALVRYKGAKNAEPKIKRSKEEARELADKLHADATRAGADFEALARTRSEDSSAERGGDLGSVGRGMFAPAFEDAAFALKPGEVSAVVETDFGFHVIQRVE